MIHKIVSLGILLSLVSENGWAQPVNTLSTQEKKDGWKLLFNGNDVTGWHSYGNKEVGKAWKIEQNALKLDIPNKVNTKIQQGGDLVTDAVYSGDFELKLEWKVARFSNSGILLFIQEDPQYKNCHETGLEIQILDDAIYEGVAQKDQRAGHRAGDLFCVASAEERQLQPVGEWNRVYCKMKQNKLKVFLNGVKIQEHDLNSEDWRQRIASSKLKNAPISKGRFAGRIGLQDWGGEVCYRNIKFRSLPRKDDM
ncbi:3-keto-disaccharide hydrolase [Spirosoma daeguense]